MKLPLKRITVLIGRTGQDLVSLDLVDEMPPRLWMPGDFKQLAGEDQSFEMRVPKGNGIELAKKLREEWCELREEDLSIRVINAKTGDISKL